MKIKSALFTQLSGSIGGMTGSHNRGGMYLRGRSVPTNPQTGLQTTVRNALATLSAKWATLTAVSRQLWDDYGANVAMVNALGDPMYLTGQQHYIRSNVCRMQAGLPEITVGPSVFTLPTFTPPTFTLASAGSGTLTVTFDDTADWCDEDDAGLIIQVGLPVSPGRNFFKGPFRFCDVILGDIASPESSPYVPSSLPFSATADNKAWIRTRLAASDGRLSSPLIVGPVVIS